MTRGRIGPGGLAGLQNRDGGAFGGSGGFDSHTSPPAPRRLPLLVAAALALALVPPGLAAQDTTEVRQGAVILEAPAATPAGVSDSAFPRPPVRPLGAFFRSLAVPGWSQAILGRRLTAGLFIAWEGVTLGMTIKATRELRHLEAQGSGLVEGKRQEREDWLTLLVFNHLFSGLEAFVAAHLWDFPDDVRIRAAPEGTGVRVTVPFRVR